MRGGVARWKRGVSSSGITSAVAYAFNGSCDATASYTEEAAGIISASQYAGQCVTRHTIRDGAITRDELDPDKLRTWFSGLDPETGERRGRQLQDPDNDLVLDATINAPKSFSLAAVLDDELADAYEALQDRVRDRVISMWQLELNARRGAGGHIREDLQQIEVVELKHERSRALDPHKHRHLWLNTKVLGQDGRWSGVDSRVMLRFQNVVNAEGELAARTDPEWLTALAAKGYSLDEDGEIRQLAHAVRPLSRRSGQIEANKKWKLAEWRKEHPGQEPDRTVLAGIDRWAWAYNRPNKPGHLDEGDWKEMIRKELADIDPTLLDDREQLAISSTAIGDIDRDRLAALAANEANGRSSANGGRFSMFDLRAAAERAVAGTGVVSQRSLLNEAIEDVTARALSAHVSDLTDSSTDQIPGHVKALMASSTATAKVNLDNQFREMSTAGAVASDSELLQAENSALAEGHSLSAGQRKAAASIGGSDRLVTITGPAGTGKTSMLKVAKHILNQHGHSMFIVAPTKKAASVAGRETSSSSSSLHGLLHDHGYRWGQGEWSRLRPGDVDPETGREWSGPVKYRVNKNDRIVVDEAGMVDLSAAQALANLATETGADIAMVGDHLQALPVGHSGAMSLMHRWSNQTVELDTVHRFQDPQWGELSLRLRDPKNAEEASQVAAEIISTGHAEQVADEDTAKQQLVTAYFAARAAGESISIVTATHDDAQAVSEQIQARRLDEGSLDASRSAIGQEGQALYIGDIVQTRKNDANSEVENRQLWTIENIDSLGNLRLASTTDSGINRTVDQDYAQKHTHLAYASTVHGVQGETTDRSIVNSDVDASGLYVGLTRGRKDNRAVVIANTEKQARDEIAKTMQRGKIEATLEDSKHAAEADLTASAHVTGSQASTTSTSSAAWNDKQARPFGRVIQLDKVHTESVEEEAKLFEKLGTLADKAASHRLTLQTLGAKQAGYIAKSHQAEATGTIVTESPIPGSTFDRANQQLEDVLTQRESYLKEWKAVTKRVSGIARERHIRQSQPQKIRDSEDTARRNCAIENAKKHRHRNQAMTGATSVSPNRGNDAQLD